MGNQTLDGNSAVFSEGLFMGVDPGVSGACAFVLADGTLATIDGLSAIYDWTTPEELLKRICPKVETEYSLLGSVKLAAFENVHSMPREGVKSTFSFGRNVGMWEMLLISCKIPYIKVSPVAWQKGSRGRPGVLDKVGTGDIKKQVFEFARRRWPDAPLHGPKGGERTGRADALCLALYASQY